MSEVATLRRRIEEECEASWQALYGVAAGTAQHEFIRARFRNIDACHTRLRELVGVEEARTMFCEIYHTQANAQGEER